MSLSKTLAFLVLVFRNPAKSQACAEHAGSHMAPSHCFLRGSRSGLGQVLSSVLFWTLSVSDMGVSFAKRSSLLSQLVISKNGKRSYSLPLLIMQRVVWLLQLR